MSAASVASIAKLDGSAPMAERVKTDATLQALVTDSAGARECLFCWRKLH